MRQASKILLLKAIIMGTIFASGSMGRSGFEEWEREGQENDLPLYRKEPRIKKMFEEKDLKSSDRAARIAELLKGIEECNAAHRNMLSQPRIFDLSVSPMSDVYEHLSRARELSTNVGKITLLNVTESQISEILNSENANRIEELAAWTTEEGYARDGHRGKFLPALKQIKNRSNIARILEQIDERNKVARALLRQPRVMDLSISSVRDVLDFLQDAHKYSGNDPIKVTLTLYNATEEQLEEIRKSPNAHRHIGELILVNEENELIDGEENLDGLGNDIHPQRIANFPRAGKATRRQDELLPEDLNDNFGNKDDGIHEPIKGFTAIPVRLGSPDDAIEPTLLSWEVTPLQEGTNHGIIKDHFGNSNEPARHASKNLVNIYCRGMESGSRAQ